VAALCLIATGCDDVYLLNPLPNVTDDRIVGSWADQEGKLAFLIRRGEGNAYQSLNAEELKKNDPGSTFFLARAGGALFEEETAKCEGHSFEAPSQEDAPKGCWTIGQFVVSGDSLELDPIDVMAMVRKITSSATPVLIGYRFSVRASKAGEPHGDILLEGSPAELADFLAAYAKDSPPATVLKLHRIG
jgi:hypothetical protein